MIEFTTGGSGVFVGPNTILTVAHNLNNGKTGGVTISRNSTNGIFDAFSNDDLSSVDVEVLEGWQFGVDFGLASQELQSKLQESDMALVKFGRDLTQNIIPISTRKPNQNELVTILGFGYFQPNAALQPTTSSKPQNIKLVGTNDIYALSDTQIATLGGGEVTRENDQMEIGPGFSGGPLLDEEGYLIAVHSYGGMTTDESGRQVNSGVHRSVFSDDFFRLVERATAKGMKVIFADSETNKELVETYNNLLEGLALNQESDETSETPLMQAAYSLNVDRVNSLVSRGRRVDVNFRDNEGRTALHHLAVGYMNQELTRDNSLKMLQILQLLDRHDVDREAKDFDSDTAVEAARKTIRYVEQGQKKFDLGLVPIFSIPPQN